MRDNFRRLRARGNASRAIVEQVALCGFRGDDRTVLYCTGLYGTVVYGVRSTERYCTYCTVQYLRNSTVLYVHYSTVLYSESAVLYSTVQYSTVVQYVQCSRPSETRR